MEVVNDMAADELAEAGLPDAHTTWAAVDLAPVLAGETLGEEPGVFSRTDGAGMLYSGKKHAINAEPEAGKTWFALGAAAELLAASSTVLYIDHETSARDVVGRLRLLGAPDERIADSLLYVRPDEPLEGRALWDLEAVLAQAPALAVVDGLTEAMTSLGLDMTNNRDVAVFMDRVVRKLEATGATVLLIDHVVKDREGRGRWALGAGHKLAAVDVAFTLTAREPFSRGRDGYSRLEVVKDRPGRLRDSTTDGKYLGDLHVSADADGSVAVWVSPPNEQASGTFRPTTLMGRISNALELGGPMSQRGVIEAVRGKRDYKLEALRALVEEGFVRRESNGQRHTYVSVRPFEDVRDDGGQA